MHTVAKQFLTNELLTDLKFLPHFTLANLVAIGPPTVMFAHLGKQTAVQYWIGDLYLLAWLAPISVIICHMIHLWYGRPRYVLMCITLFIPSTLLCGLAKFLPVPVASQMLSSDCITFADKYFLQEAYRAAEDLYYECTDALAASKNMTVEVVRKTHTLDDCTAFNMENSDYAAEWKFLKNMELNNDCKGWCYETDTSLWSINPQPRDLCSKEVGMLAKGTVTSSVNFVLYTGCLGAIASVASVYAYENIFNSYGLPW